MPRPVTLLSSRLCPATVRHPPYSLSKRDQLIDWDVFEGFNKAVGPVHHQVDRSIVSEAEVQAGIAAGIETALTYEALRLCFPAITGQNPGPDRAPIGLHALKFHLKPILLPLDVIAQQGRGLVHVYDEDVDVTIIIEIPERTSPAAVRRSNAGAGSFDQFLEGVIAEIPKHHARCPVRILRECSFDFWVNVSGDDKDIRISIIVKVHDSRTPAHIACLHANVRLPGNIVEIPLAVVVVKNAGIIREVRLEEI